MVLHLVTYILGPTNQSCAATSAQLEDDPSNVVVNTDSHRDADGICRAYLLDMTDNDSEPELEILECDAEHSAETRKVNKS